MTVLYSGISFLARQTQKLIQFLAVVFKLWNGKRTGDLFKSLKRITQSMIPVLQKKKPSIYPTVETFA